MRALVSISASAVGIFRTVRYSTLLSHSQRCLKSQPFKLQCFGIFDLIHILSTIHIHTGWRDLHTICFFLKHSPHEDRLFPIQTGGG